MQVWLLLHYFIVFILVGNACDDFQREEINEEEAKEYADSIGIDLFLVSAKTGMNVNKLINDIENKIIKLIHDIEKNGIVKIIKKNNIQKNIKKQCI